METNNSQADNVCKGHVNNTTSDVRTSRATGSSGDRILTKLKNMIDKNELYEAHQLYRTLSFRYQNWGKFNELQDLLFDGTLLFLQREQVTSGSDLASLYLDSLKNDPNIGQLLSKTDGQLYENIGLIFKNIPAKTQERLEFVVKALKFDNSLFDLNQLHHKFALILFAEKDYIDARYHFLHAGSYSGKDAAEMLIEYQISSGLNTEVDLYVARFVLQVLFIKPIQVAEPVETDQKLVLTQERSVQHGLAWRTLKHYVETHPRIKSSSPPFPFPLIDFIWALVHAIQGGQASTLGTLCETYAVEICRDEEFKRYLQGIGQMYFGIPPPQQRRPGGIFGSLIQSLLADETEENDGVSVNSNVTQPATLPQTTASQVVHDEELD